MVCGECAFGCVAERKNILFPRSFAGVGISFKTLGGSAKLRTTLRNNIFFSPRKFGVAHSFEFASMKLLEVSFR